MTKTMARVSHTCSRVASTKMVLSVESSMLTPSGRLRRISGIFACTARATSSSLALDWRMMPTPTVDFFDVRAIIA